MEKVKVTVPMILGMLEKGKDRDQIGEELGLSKADVKRMFQHPELKGKKVKKYVEPAFEFVDEVEIVEPTNETDNSQLKMWAEEQEA